MADAALARPRVVVSVLNWNGAEETVDCVRALLAAPHDGLDLRVVVVDNGSRADDLARLEVGLRGSGAELRTLPANIGFAAGHNVVAREALVDGTEFLWLLNNDTSVPPGTLPALVDFMRADPRCGAASPVINALHDATLMDFCGAVHDWPALASRRPNDLATARRLEATQPQDAWLHGTALLLRTAALREAGLLDESYFAYYEDDDLGVRLARAGWRNRVCFDITVQHARRVVGHAERPAYFFYLMARNALLFWGRHAEPPHRRSLRRRLLARSLIEAAKLRQHGQRDKADACLVGALHGLRGQAGAPDFAARRPPLWLRLASALPYRIASRMT